MLESDPRIDDYEDVLLVPAGIEGASPGLYDRSRRMILVSGTFRGVPSLSLVHGSFTSTVDPDDVGEVVDQANLVFGGFFEPHFGHFLLSSLSRFWWLLSKPHSAIKIVLLNREPLALLFERPFVRETMRALKLSPEHFTSFDRPVRLRRISVPDASLQENNCVHRAFATLCNHIGEVLLPNSITARNNRPVYLSKSKVRFGVSTLVNEDEFCGHLDARGVDIVYPETLPFAEQIRIFKERLVVAGQIGSALHTGVFSPANRLLVLNHGEEIWSNQLLLDGANRNQSLYLNPREHLVHIGSGANFGNQFRLVDPGRVAAEFTRALDALMAAEGASPVSAPHGVNLSRGRPAWQSSRSPWSRGRTPEDDAAGAVSGWLTGSYQIHTAQERNPWWSVDLGQICLIEEVQLYNRLDGLAFRNARFRLMASREATEWVTVMIRETPDPFGGLDGKPFVWCPDKPLLTRFFRVELLEEQSLQLDQVQLFGRRV